MVRLYVGAISWCCYGGRARNGEPAVAMLPEQSEAGRALRRMKGAGASCRELRPHPREPKHGVDTQRPRVDLLLPSVGHGRE
jgi:hypothetical protein